MSKFAFSGRRSQGRLFPVTFLLLLIILTARYGQARAVADAIVLGLEPVASGLSWPVQVVSPPGDARLFIPEQRGMIWIVAANGTKLATPFLDITDRAIQNQGGNGLFGMAFDPDYATNGRFYIHYSVYVPNGSGGNDRYSRISRFTVSPGNANLADKSTENILLTIKHPGNSHNAGDLQFGPDGYLYIPMGDGSAGVFTMSPQDPAVLHGKLLRINPDHDPAQADADCYGLGTGDYSVPPGNPYLGQASGCDEIWASGLRNPWRISFDRQTGDLYIGDVGQNALDEVDYLPAGSAAGANFGWPCYEADQPYAPPGTPGCGPASGYVMPVLIEPLVDGGHCSVTGGFVYRGQAIPALAGRYLYGDYCTGVIGEALKGTNGWTKTDHPEVAAFDLVSFGQDRDGEVYIVNRDGGTVKRLVAGGLLGTIYLSAASGGTIASGAANALPYSNADIVAHNGATDLWSKPLPATASGIAKNVRGFALLPGGEALYALAAGQTFSQGGASFTITPWDALAYDPSTNTKRVYLIGGQVGLSTDGERIDALAVAPDGRLVISTIGGGSAPCAIDPAACPTGKLAFQDEDLIIFNPAAGHTGPVTKGTWALYFDGTGVPGLGIEDVGGASIAADGALYLSVYDSYKVGGVTGNARRIFTVSISGAGYTVRNVWFGKDYAYPGAIDAFDVQP